MEFSGSPVECRRVLATVKYLVTSAVFSGYALKGQERLTISNLLCGRNWRSREKQLFRYVDGVWKRWEGRIEFTSQDEMIAVEGLFISLASEEPTWKWLAKKCRMSQLKVFIFHMAFVLPKLGRRGEVYREDNRH